MSNANTMNELNDILFSQLRRLENAVEMDELAMERDRAKAMTSVAHQIISNASTALDAQRFAAETIGRSKVNVPKMLENGHE